MYSLMFTLIMTNIYLIYRQLVDSISFSKVIPDEHHVHYCHAKMMNELKAVK